MEDRDDYGLVEAVCEALAAYADEDGIWSLSETERTVLLPYWAKAIVDNGGFLYFYSGADNANEVAEALEKIGCSGVAAAFRRSAELFPDGRPIRGEEARSRWLEEHEAEADALFAELNPTVWSSDEELWTRLAAYIRSHRTDLERVGHGYDRVGPA
jgi:hypothetical protein